VSEAKVHYRCPRCSRAAAWTDGTMVAAGDERDEYWCQTCGEETPLEDCEVVNVCPHSRTRVTRTLAAGAHMVQCLDCKERVA
jgi:DNA-directed RNA polymerase subunit RPC12/RpoP